MLTNVNKWIEMLTVIYTCMYAVVSIYPSIHPSVHPSVHLSCVVYNVLVFYCWLHLKLLWHFQRVYGVYGAVSKPYYDTPIQSDQIFINQRFNDICAQGRLVLFFHIGAFGALALLAAVHVENPTQTSWYFKKCHEFSWIFMIYLLCGSWR